MRAAVEEIKAGEAFQIVVSQRFETPCPADALDVYRVLRGTNPSPYLYLLRLEGLDIVGSSPEALVTVQDRVATTRPIAGSRPRGATPEADRRLAEELLDLRRIALLAAGHGGPQVEVEGLVDARLAFALVAQGRLGAAHLGRRGVALAVGPGGHRRAAGGNIEKTGPGVAQERRGIAPALGPGGLAAQLEVGLGLLHPQRAVRPGAGGITGGGRGHRAGIGRVGRASQRGQGKGQPAGQRRKTHLVHGFNPAPSRGAS